MTRLEIEPADGGTCVITATFTDSAGSSVIPTSITWSLSNGDLEIINDREDVVIAIPAASVSITLSGDDLLYLDGPDRIFVISIVYDSTEGSNLPNKAQAHFNIENILID